MEYKDHILSEAIRLVFLESRRQRGLTQNGLSLRSNITRQFISQVEVGKRLPSINTICALANAYNKSLSQLFYEVDRFYPLIEKKRRPFKIPANIAAETRQKLIEYINNAQKQQDSASTKPPPSGNCPGQ
ncbi:helix-turn-helix domain-containing protein [Fibrobacter sp.]|uniref:helix-turn-helix domain-containing protein n=1 Tax=Fibrobacter sp. TaxID=35828 RepID=UPI0038708C7E